jgi:hypothetical protein
MKLQLVVQEVFTPTPGPSPKNWGRGVKLMGCFSGRAISHCRVGDIKKRRVQDAPIYYAGISQTAFCFIDQTAYGQVAKALTG